MSSRLSYLTARCAFSYVLRSCVLAFHAEMIRMAPSRSVYTTSDHRAVVFTQRDQPAFAIVAAQVLGHDDDPAKNLSRLSEADTVLCLIGGIFRWIPFEPHRM